MSSTAFAGSRRGMAPTLRLGGKLKAGLLTVDGAACSRLSESGVAGLEDEGAQLGKAGAVVVEFNERVSAHFRFEQIKRENGGKAAKVQLVPNEKKRVDKA